MCNLVLIGLNVVNIGFFQVYSQKSIGVPNCVVFGGIKAPNVE